MKKYYSLVTENREADVYIFGDITSWPWLESDVSSYNLAHEIVGLDVDIINVHINSYGGEVSEGLAIYNSLKNHPAKIKTICDGFACSAASVIFMAGDERVMNAASLLMIHNAWTYAGGNAKELRKTADDLDIISQASVNAYLERINIDEAELQELLDAESWILPADALAMGFATTIVSADVATEKAAANGRKALFGLVTAGMPGANNPNLEPPPAGPKSPIENKTMNFLNALLGGKE